MRFINKEYIRKAMYGLIVGDALGVPYEFKMRDSFRVEGMTGYGTHSQPAGTWSDDTSMNLAALCSFIERETIHHNDIMERFRRWKDHGEYCPHGKCFDIGGATSRAIERFTEGCAPLECGGKENYDNGNGSLMRILPIAFVPHTEIDVARLSELTHAHNLSILCCLLYVQLAERLMQGILKEEAVKGLCGCIGKCARIPNIAELERDDIASSGFVLDTLEAAIWCLLKTDSYKECVITAVELGDDTDTVAAVAGGLAGIYYGIGGEKGIPTEWIDILARKEWLDELISKAEQLAQ